LTYINWWNWHEKDNKNVDFIVQFKEINDNFMVLVNDKQSFVLKNEHMKKENLGKLFFLRCFDMAPSKGNLKKIA